MITLVRAGSYQDPLQLGVRRTPPPPSPDPDFEVLKWAIISVLVLLVTML